MGNKVTSARGRKWLTIRTMNHANCTTTMRHTHFRTTDTLQMLPDMYIYELHNGRQPLVHFQVWRWFQFTFARNGQTPHTNSIQDLHVVHTATKLHHCRYIPATLVHCVCAHKINTATVMLKALTLSRKCYQSETFCQQPGKELSL